MQKRREAAYLQYAESVYKARRWMVERNQKLLERCYEAEASYLVLLLLVADRIRWRQTICING